MSIYQTCTNAHGGDIDLVMECVVGWVETDIQGSIIDSVKREELTDWLLILCGSLVFFMQGKSDSISKLIECTQAKKLKQLITQKFL